MLAKSFNSTVYLLSLRNQSENKDHTVVDKTLELVQSLSTIPVQCFLLEGQNLAKVRSISLSASMQILSWDNPERISFAGLWNRMTNKLLSYGSKVPVLTVEKSTGLESQV